MPSCSFAGFGATGDGEFRASAMDDLTLTTNGDGAQIALPAVLDLCAAEPLKAAFDKALAGGRPLTVDAEGVERLSTPCIQILIAAEAGMRAAELPFKLAKPSDAFIDTFSDLGVFSLLKQWDIEG